MKFAFPEPGPFEGVKSHSKVVLYSVSDNDKECIEFKSNEFAINVGAVLKVMGLVKFIVCYFSGVCQYWLRPYDGQCD